MYFVKDIIRMNYVLKSVQSFLIEFEFNLGNFRHFIQNDKLFVTQIFVLVKYVQNKNKFFSCFCYLILKNLAKFCLR